MAAQSENTEQIAYPYIVFRIGDSLYCINSKYVTTIVQLPEFEEVPDMPSYFTGLFLYRGEPVYMLDLRTLLNLPTLQQVFYQFQGTIEERKQDHINWTEKLKECVTCDADFPLATDPHQCKLGKWFDHFHTNNQSLRFHLNKLDAPHQRLHHMAHEIKLAEQRTDTVHATKIIDEIEQQYVPQVLSLLDEAAEVFHTQMYHEMALLLHGQGSCCSIIVDEVYSVELLADMGTQNALNMLQASPYLLGVKKSDRIEQIIIEVNAKNIMQLMEQLSAKQAGTSS